MATRRRTTPRRPPKATEADYLAAWVIALPILVIGGLLKLARAAWKEMSDDQHRDTAGLGLWALAFVVVASMAFPHPWLLAGVHAKTLGLVGYGWPGLVGGMVATGFLLIHPAPAKGLKRYQGIALGFAAWAWLGLISLWWGAGGLAGAVLSANLTGLLGGAGAAVALLLALTVALLFARGLPLAEIPGRVWEAVRVRMPGRVAAEDAATAPSASPDTLADDRHAEGEAELATQSRTPGTAPDLVGEDEAAGADPELVTPFVQAEADRRWKLPPIDLLDPLKAPTKRSAELVKAQVAEIEDVLGLNGAPAKVEDVDQGPTVTRYRLGLPRGCRPKQVSGLLQDLAVAVKATGDLRLEIPIPGTGLLGLEVPKGDDRRIVHLREAFAADGLAPPARHLGLALGADVAGAPIWADLAKMVHLLIAGATGQGKSVCLNALICCLLLLYGPNRVRFVMIDPKRVELKGFRGLPHLACPVITDSELARGALEWAVGEMERRYALLEQQDARNLADYNARAGEHQVQPLPYIVIVIDELADLMMVVKDADRLIARLGQKARAAGIHLVVATQRPSVDVVTGLVKANVPSRIAFAVDSHTNSGVILGSAGAEKLLGAGDALYQSVNSAKPQRLQGAFVSDRELEAVVNHWVRQLHGKPPEYLLRLDDPEPVEATA